MPRKATEVERLEVIALAVVRMSQRSAEDGAAWKSIDPHARDILQDAASNARERIARGDSIEL